LLRNSHKIETGDLIFFASTRAHLDVFHCGILIRNGHGVLLRHASRSKGSVVEQPLGEFLKQNRMAGAIVVRSTESN
jgi:cell wall-associated NlpC family hydrolase